MQCTGQTPYNVFGKEVEEVWVVRVSDWRATPCAGVLCNQIQPSHLLVHRQQIKLTTH
jgi:hypothetical protein